MVIKQSGFALQFVKEQTKDICLEAVKQREFALQFVKKEFKEVCLNFLNNSQVLFILYSG